MNKIYDSLPKYKIVKIYFIVCRETMRVKIGITERNINDRLKIMQIGSPTILEILSYEIGDVGYEKRLHDNFRKYHYHGEWFNLSYEILEYIENNCKYINSDIPLEYLRTKLNNKESVA